MGVSLNLGYYLLMWRTPPIASGSGIGGGIGGGIGAGFGSGAGDGAAASAAATLAKVFPIWPLGTAPVQKSLRRNEVIESL